LLVWKLFILPINARGTVICCWDFYDRDWSKDLMVIERDDLEKK